MTSEGRGWWGLKAILEDNRRLQEENEAQGIPGTHGIMTCPNDGSILQLRQRDGLWNCPMGDYRTTSGPQEPRR